MRGQMRVKAGLQKGAAGSLPGQHAGISLSRGVLGWPSSPYFCTLTRETMALGSSPCSISRETSGCGT